MPKFPVVVHMWLKGGADWLLHPILEQYRDPIREPIKKHVRFPGKGEELFNERFRKYDLVGLCYPDNECKDPKARGRSPFVLLFACVPENEVYDSDEVVGELRKLGKQLAQYDGKAELVVTVSEQQRFVEVPSPKESSENTEPINTTPVVQADIAAKELAPSSSDLEEKRSSDLKEKLNLAINQIRQLELELKSSQRGYDDLKYEAKKLKKKKGDCEERIDTAGIKSGYSQVGFVSCIGFAALGALVGQIDVDIGRLISLLVIVAAVSGMYFARD